MQKSGVETPVKTENLHELRQQINDLSNTEQSEVLKIIKKHDTRLTENKNGFFINMNNLSSDSLLEIRAFVNYSIENNKRLEKLEELSDRLLKQSIQSTQDTCLHPLTQDSNRSLTDQNQKSVATQSQPESKEKPINKNTHRVRISGNQKVELDFMEDMVDPDLPTGIPKMQASGEPDGEWQATELLINSDINGIEAASKNSAHLDKCDDRHDGDALAESTKKQKIAGVPARILKKCKEINRSVGVTSHFFDTTIDHDLEDDVDDVLLQTSDDSELNMDQVP